MSAADALLRRRLAMMLGVPDPSAGGSGGGGSLPSAPANPSPSLPGQPQAPGAMGGAPTMGQPPSPFAPNPQLEAQAQAQGFEDPMNPIIAAIQKRLGLMNLVRNRQNMQGVGMVQ